MKSDDVISRQAAIDTMDETLKRVFVAPRDIAEKMINKIPSVIPKMVKCGDCRWNDGTAYCEFHYRAVKGDDFCSWAERRYKDEQYPNINNADDCVECVKYADAVIEAEGEE